MLASGSALAEEVLRRRLRADLAAYKVPRHVLFAARAELSFTDSGKIDKRRLAALLAARLGDGA